MDSTAVGLSFIRLLSLSFHFCYALHTHTLDLSFCSYRNLSQVDPQKSTFRNCCGSVVLGKRTSATNSLSSC